MANAKKVPAKQGNVTGLRVAAFLFWAVAIMFEVFAILSINGNMCLPFFGEENALLYSMISWLVADLIFVIVGSRIWVAANHRCGKVQSWIVNNLGVIVAVIAFAPFIIILLTDKKNKLDPKTKKIGAIVAVVALAIAGVSSYDSHPLTKEDVLMAQAFYTEAGTKNHLSRDCQTLRNSDPDKINDEHIIKDSPKKGGICKFCEKHWGEEAKKASVSVAPAANE